MLSAYLLVNCIIRIAWGGGSFRTVASAYNGILLLSGAMILASSQYYFENAFASNREALIKFSNLNKTIFFIMVSTVILTISYCYAKGIFELSMPTLFGFLTPDMGGNLLGSAQSAKFIRTDWAMGEMSPRSTVFAPYPNASVFILVMLGLFSQLKYENLKNINSTIITCAIFICFFAFSSRTALGGFIMGTFVSMFLFKSVLSKTFIIFFFVAAAVLGALYLNDISSSLISYRAGSNSLRFLNYEAAITAVFTENLFFGLGIKPMDDSIAGIPLGSHSTFVSIFTKGGLIAFIPTLFIFVILPFSLFYKLFSFHKNNPEVRGLYGSKIYHLCRIQIFMWTWICFEDIDAVAIVVFLTFLFYGYTLALYNTIKKQMYIIVI
ncbi:hypothetical protein N9123_00805 [Pseudomonadales bacterium]|nr:hypothetical protein [Pseudomonadales bacterium]